MAAPENRRLLELAGLFLKLGTTAFGGPAAHIALMEIEFVRRRQWLTRAEFLDLLGLVNLIPGPSSTELAIFIGYRRAGWRGLVLAGVGFILPAFLIVSAIAWVYVHYGTLPRAAGIMHGIKPVIIAIIAQALWNLAPVAVKSRWLAMLGAVAVTLSLLGCDPIAILLGAGLFMVTGRGVLSRSAGCFMPVPLLGTSGPSLAVGSVMPFKLGSMFFFFLKIGSVVFGSGYLLLAFLRTDLVTRWHWLTETQLLDAVAVGQFTPGPVFTTATFIGYLLGGPQAAVAATAAIFLPSFLLVGLCGPWLPRLRQSPVVGAFLDGVNVAALALMVAVTWQLGRVALVDGFTVAEAVIALGLLLRYKINSAWLVLGGAGLGWFVS